MSRSWAFIYDPCFRGGHAETNATCVCVSTYKNIATYARARAARSIRERILNVTRAPVSFVRRSPEKVFRHFRRYRTGRSRRVRLVARILRTDDNFRQRTPARRTCSLRRSLRLTNLRATAGLVSAVIARTISLRAVSVHGICPSRLVHDNRVF